MEEEKKMDEQKLEEVAGGYAMQDYVHDLNLYVYRTVYNLPAGTCLQMQITPNGAFMKEMYWQGEPIFVHKNYWENGYFLAYRNGVYGYVDAKYVR
ncbi:MAG: hypothetical protein J6S83_10330 [Lachnospiraceae bacterium]|nr:hypothetical protein [Lachnospiraceae bacterium]